MRDHIHALGVKTYSGFKFVTGGEKLCTEISGVGGRDSALDVELIELQQFGIAYQRGQEDWVQLCYSRGGRKKSPPFGAISRLR